jgi:N-methylhydantoinase A
MSVPLPEGAALADTTLLDLAGRFHDLHEAERGFAFRNQQPTVRGVRLIARGLTPKPPSLGETGGESDATAARTGSREVFWGEARIDTPIFDGARLGLGATVEGPALIEEPFTVVVVPPRASCTLGEAACYDLRL